MDLEIASGLGNSNFQLSFLMLEHTEFQFSRPCGPKRIEKNLYVTSRVKMQAQIRPCDSSYYV